MLVLLNVHHSSQDSSLVLEDRCKDDIGILGMEEKAGEQCPLQATNHPTYTPIHPIA